MAVANEGLAPVAGLLDDLVTVTRTSLVFLLAPELLFFLAAADLLGWAALEDLLVLLLLVFCFCARDLLVD
jgi:hypothetical protein